MNIVQTVVMALCLWCGATPSIAASHDSEECYQSVSQTRQSHPEGHIRHHKTPNGICYHVGPKNHSGTFVDTKPSPKKIGTNTAKVNVLNGSTIHAEPGVPEWNSGAKRVDSFTYRFIDKETTRWRHAPWYPAGH